MENELFGHVRGSFTGAADDKPGRLEAGGGGTILFDEIADLPTSLQAKISSASSRIAASSESAAIVRSRSMFASSQRPIEISKPKPAAGRFRRDLYYRLNVIEFTLPPLRDGPRISSVSRIGCSR